MCILSLLEHVHWARQWRQWQLDTYMFPAPCHLSRVCLTTQAHTPCAPRSHRLFWGLLLFLCSSTTEKDKEPLTWGSFYLCFLSLIAPGIRQGRFVLTHLCPPSLSLHPNSPMALIRNQACETPKPEESLLSPFSPMASFP